MFKWRRDTRKFEIRIFHRFLDEKQNLELSVRWTVALGNDAKRAEMSKFYERINATKCQDNGKIRRKTLRA